MGYSTLEQKLTNIAQAMRNLDGTTELLTLEQMRQWLSTGWKKISNSPTVGKFSTASSCTKAYYSSSNYAPCSGFNLGGVCVFPTAQVNPNLSTNLSSPNYTSASSDTTSASGDIISISENLTVTTSRNAVASAGQFFKIGSKAYGGLNISGTSSARAEFYSVDSSMTVGAIPVGVVKGDLNPAASYASGDGLYMYPNTDATYARKLIHTTTSGTTSIASNAISLGNAADSYKCLGNSRYFGFIWGSSHFLCTWTRDLTFVDNILLPNNYYGSSYYPKRLNFEAEGVFGFYAGYNSSSAPNNSVVLIDEDLTVFSSYAEYRSDIGCATAYINGVAVFLAGRGLVYAVTVDANGTFSATQLYDQNDTMATGRPVTYSSLIGSIGNKLIAAAGKDKSGSTNYYTNRVSSVQVANGKTVKITKTF